MSYFLLFILISLNFFSLQFKKKSVGVIVLSILIFSILLGGNNNNPDYWAYEENYRLVQNDNSYFGFDFLWGPFMKIGGYLGLSYNEFLLTASLIAYSFLFYFLFSRMDYRIHKVLLLYCVYSFFIVVVQIANFFANVLAVIALLIIMDYRWYRKRIKLFLFLLLIVCAMGFHMSAIFFLPIFLFKNFSFKIKYFVYFSIFLSITDTFFAHVFLDRIMAIIPLGETYLLLKDYGANISSGFGFVICIAIILLLIELVRKNLHCLIKKCRKFKIDIPSQDMVNCNSVIFLLRYLLLLTPIFAISSIAFVRIIRAVLIYYGITYNIDSISSKRMLLLDNILLILIFFYLFQTDIGSDVFFDIMNNNIFLNER